MEFRKQLINAAEKYVTFGYPWIAPPPNGETDNTKKSVEIGVAMANLAECDKQALAEYSTFNGVPYSYGNKCSLKDLGDALKELKPKWTDYAKDKRPGDEQAGLDCSGLVKNCLTETNAIMNNYFPIENIRGNSSQIGKNSTRLIPLNIVTDEKTLIQSGDLLYTQYEGEGYRHIAICSNDYNYFSLKIK
jgi:cell wall-associated NlpC family hydrolase